MAMRWTLNLQWERLDGHVQFGQLTDGVDGCGLILTHCGRAKRGFAANDVRGWLTDGGGCIGCVCLSITALIAG